MPVLPIYEAEPVLLEDLFLFAVDEAGELAAAHRVLQLADRFGFDLADHMARRRSFNAVEIAPEIRRYFGIGNATGQGMSTFVMKWPRWIHAWNLVREKSIAIALDQQPSFNDIGQVQDLLNRARVYFSQNAGEDDGVFLPASELAVELSSIENAITTHRRRQLSWLDLSQWASKLPCKLRRRRKLVNLSKEQRV